MLRTGPLSVTYSSMVPSLSLSMSSSGGPGMPRVAIDAGAIPFAPRNQQLFWACRLFPALPLASAGMVQMSQKLLGPVQCESSSQGVALVEQVRVQSVLSAQGPPPTLQTPSTGAKTENPLVRSGLLALITGPYGAEAEVKQGQIGLQVDRLELGRRRCRTPRSAPRCSSGRSSAWFQAQSGDLDRVVRAVDLLRSPA